MSERPRLCVVIPSLNVGGTERQAVHLVEKLAADFFIRVVCTREAGTWADRVRDVAEMDVLGLKSGWDPRILVALRRIFRAWRPDIVQTFMFGFDYWSNAAAKRAGVPVVVSSRRQRATWKRRRHVWLQRRANAMADAIVANSQAVADFAAEQEGETRERYTVIHNGVDVAEEPAPNADPRVELTVPRGAPVIGMVANFSVEKDHRMFVAMAERVHAARHDAHFVLAGDGPERAAIQRAVVDRGLGDAFRFVSGRDDVRTLYAAIDVVVLCSKTEGFPNALMEAMACGKPIVASCVGGIPELVEDGATGLLIRERTPEGFAEAVLSLISNASEARRMGDRGRERVREAFSVDRMAAGYLDLYLRLLDRARSRGVS